MNNENHLSDAFLKFYDDKVQPLAMKCAAGYQTMVAMENGQTFPDDNTDVVRIKTHHDAIAIWFTGQFMSDVAYHRVKGIRLNIINSLHTLSGTLNSDSYWTNVWNNDFSSQDAQDLRELGKLMKELSTMQLREESGNLRDLAKSLVG